MIKVMAKCGMASFLLIVASASIGSTSDQAQKDAGTDDKEKVTCKHTKVLGSRIKEKKSA